MRTWLALWLFGLVACAAQDQAECGSYKDLAPRRASRRSARSGTPEVDLGAQSRRSALEDNFMRFGRSGRLPGDRLARADNFVRFGRASGEAPEVSEVEVVERGGGDQGTSGFIRFGRSGRSGTGTGQDDNYVRFGRPDHQSNFVRFGRMDLSYLLRFGRPDGSNYVRFGRADPSNYVRFGRADPSNFVRFGRDGEGEEGESLLEDKEDEQVRDYRSKHHSQMHMDLHGKGGAWGRADNTDKRTKDGKGGPGGGDSNFVRFGRSYVDEEESPEGEAAGQAARDDSRTKRA